MRAERLTELLIFERGPGTAKDSFGAPVPVWSEFARARAEITERSEVREAVAERGSIAATGFTFRARWTPGIMLTDRVRFDGIAFDIISLAQIGRRDGLEISCRRVG